MIPIWVLQYTGILHANILWLWATSVKFYLYLHYLHLQFLCAEIRKFPRIYLNKNYRKNFGVGHGCACTALLWCVRLTGRQGCCQVENSGVDGVTEGAIRTHGEREPITGVWGQSPERSPGAEPSVRRSGGLAPPPLKLKGFCRWTTQTSGKICHFSLAFLKLPSKPK